MKIKDTLSTNDLQKWGADTLVYCILPATIVFLQSLQTGDFKFALGAAEVALLASLTNLLGKYKAGLDSVGLQNNILEDKTVSEPIEATQTTPQVDQTVTNLPNNPYLYPEKSV